MWPLVVGAGALWYLTRLRRNPDWITTNGVHRPIYGKGGTGGDGRAGDATPYDDARLKEPPKTIRRSGSAPSSSGSAQALARAERLRALEAKRREEVAARSPSLRFHLREAAMAGGGVMTARRAAGNRRLDQQIRKSAALTNEAESFERRAAYQEARAKELAASEEKVAGGPLAVGSRVHLWYTWGYGQYEGIGTIVKRLKNGWSVKVEKWRSSAVPSPRYPRGKESDWEGTNRTPETYPALGDKGYTANREKYPRTGIDGFYVKDHLVPIAS